MSESVQSFKLSPLSGGYRLLTAAYLVVVALGVLGILAVAGYWPQRLLLPVLGFGVLCVPGGDALAHRRPMRIEIRPDHMRFVRPFGWWDMELSAIKSVEMTTWREVGRPRRLLGTLGIFGLFALFRTADRRWYRAMVTRGDGIVMMARRQRPPLLFTPADTEGFVRAIEEVLQRRSDRDARLRELST
jgi:hypothetical protein